MSALTPEDREELKAACLSGLVLTEHGYKYRPALGAEAVETILARHITAAVNQKLSDAADEMGDRAASFMHRAIASPDHEHNCDCEMAAEVAARYFTYRSAARIIRARLT